MKFKNISVLGIIQHCDFLFQLHFFQLSQGTNVLIVECPEILTYNKKYWTVNADETI